MKSSGPDAGWRKRRTVWARSAAPMPLPAPTWSIEIEKAVSQPAWPGGTIGGIASRSRYSGAVGMHTSPRAQRSMKLIASGLTHSAAIVRSPSFSRSSSSATRTISPRRIRRRASSMLANFMHAPLGPAGRAGRPRLAGAVLVGRTIVPLASCGDLLGLGDSGRARQGDDHAAPVRLARFGMDVAAVQVDDPAGDREAESGPAVRRCARGVGAVEAFEDAGDVVGGDARALVDDLDRHAGVAAPRPYLHGRAGG